jgi:hypothetical protein
MTGAAVAAPAATPASTRSVVASRCRIVPVYERLFRTQFSGRNRLWEGEIGRGRIARVWTRSALAVAAALAFSSGPAVGADLPIRVDIPYSMIVRVVGSDQYQIEVDNTNPTKYINSFNWSPPSGMTVTAVTSSEGGKCDVSEGMIKCRGRLQPPNCMCVGQGLIVNFTATGREPTWMNGYWIHYGVVGGLQITGTTPVHVQRFSDAPLCKTGQKSTLTHPCAKR